MPAAAVIQRWIISRADEHGVCINAEAETCRSDGYLFGSL
jgi:hypothetical protein